MLFTLAVASESVPLDLETSCLNRYPSAVELADELVWYQRGDPILTRSVRHLELAVKWVKRNPVVAVAAAVVLAPAAGTSVSYRKYLDAEQQRGIAAEDRGNASHAPED